MPGDSEAAMASAAVARTGASATASVLRSACAVEQIEQAWWEAVESSGWACTACTTPIVHTSAMERMQTTLKKALRFVAALTMP
jgi:acyl-CoA reductase-like NAD-dependent aldehyde dehydrogenase